jgi:hypothetical protein
MKIILILVSSMVLFFSSCMKTKTCTCTYPGTSEVYSGSSKKTNSKRELKEFEEACKNEKLLVTTSDGNGNTTETIYTDVCKVN